MIGGDFSTNSERSRKASSDVNSAESRSRSVSPCTASVDVEGGRRTVVFSIASRPPMRPEVRSEAKAGVLDSQFGRVVGFAFADWTEAPVIPREDCASQAGSAAEGGAVGTFAEIDSASAASLESPGETGRLASST